MKKDKTQVEENLNRLNLRVSRLNEEIDGDMPYLIIKNEFILIQKALDELKIYYTENYGE